MRSHSLHNSSIYIYIALYYDFNDSKRIQNNFYTIIDIAKDLLTSNDWWSINEEEIKKSEERKAKEKSQEEDNDQK